MSDETQSPPSTFRRRLLGALPLILFGALAMVFLVRLFGGDPSRLPSALIGKQVPDFKMEALPGLVKDGKPMDGFSTGILYGNKVTLVNVWASWCVPCRAEHPFLMELAKRPDIQVVGLNYKDKPANARRFLGTHGNPYERVGVDPTGRVSVDWGVYGVPETFVVDKKGVIRFKQIGPLTQDSLKRFLPQIEAAKVELVR